MSWLKAIGRLFTMPAKTRAKLKANPLAPVVQGLLASELQAVIQTTVNNNVKDAAAAQAVTEALGHAVASTGIFN